MTPLAAQLFCKGDNPKVRDALLTSQFLECSRIVDLAQEMGLADVECGSSPYSLFAVLPAHCTSVEFLVPGSGTRMLLLCEQRNLDIAYCCFVPGPHGVPRVRYTSGFTLGTETNAAITWVTHADERTQTEMSAEQIATARGTNLLLEKVLCILNQPGLIDRVPRQTDKRVLRTVPSAAASHIATWHECRIRAGRHSNPGDCGADGPLMPLHYVRKYFRPSSGQWIEGYWRGDADLGVHLKWYSASKTSNPRPAYAATPGRLAATAR